MKEMRSIGIWLALIFALFQLCVPVFFHLNDLQLRPIHIFLGLSVVFLASSNGKSGEGKTKLFFWYLFLIGIVLVATINVLYKWLPIYLYPDQSKPEDLVLGILLTGILVEASRRNTGWAIPICVIFMFVYVFLGPYMPGMWVHPGFSLTHVMESVYYSSLGIYGSITGMSATFLALFLIFGALLRGTGMGRTFMEFAILIAGRFRGGPAKVAVVASSLFGSISGSAVANVSVTGNYTIPLMKRLGYNPNFAGGVETMASTGGGITPPIMSTSAFIMAELTGEPYIKIIGYAIIPCLLFYTGIMAGIHAEALRMGLDPMPKEEIPDWRKVLHYSKIVPFFTPIAILLWLLLKGSDLLIAGFYSCVAIILLHIFIDFSLSGMKERFFQIIKALSEGGKAVAMIMPILVNVNIFVVLLGLTGVAPKISQVIINLGQERMIGALLVSAALPFLLGTALPVAATYILSAALIAPSLIGLRFDIVSVHMFLIYWAILASVTPPTCVPAVIAANLARGNWLKVAFTAMRLGIVAFLLPFFFMLNPALLGRGEPADILLHGLSGLAGSFCLAFCFFGYARSHLNVVFRILYGCCGIMLLYPSYILSLGGAAVATILLLVESFYHPKTPRKVKGCGESITGS